MLSHMESKRSAKPIPLELLAPARNAEVAIEAIKHGADAVYMGAGAFGARAAATNSVADIRRVTEYAHRFNVRVYVTVNTIVYDHELDSVQALIWNLYHAGVDALIVQDMALLELNLPPIALHASTQCDTRTPEKARFLQDVGFSQIVLPREMTLAEIAAVRSVTEVPLEGFVHGALCVSYSGDCHAGQCATGRSANRGECPQMCRLRYSLSDKSGREVAPPAYYLSLRDLNRLEHLTELAEAGITSFKIEGRLKDAAYVKNVTAAYSMALDRLVNSSHGKYVRASDGVIDLKFRPDVESVFNRGFTSFYLSQPFHTGPGMASIRTPKWVGEPIGRVTQVKGKCIITDTDSKLNNGDGLCYFNTNGELTGIRINRADGRKLFVNTQVQISAGTELFRNLDAARAVEMARNTSQRYIKVDMHLAYRNSCLLLTCDDRYGHAVTVNIKGDFEVARTPQSGARRNILSKLGDTDFRLDSFIDKAGDIFVPASVLTQLRRNAVNALMHARAATYVYDYRRKELDHVVFPAAEVDYHANVANSRSSEFYSAHGVKVTMPAAELRTPAGSPRVMTTRYCVRAELGICPRMDSRYKADPLFLKHGKLTYRLEFTCGRCGMEVFQENA